MQAQNPSSGDGAVVAWSWGDRTVISNKVLVIKVPSREVTETSDSSIVCEMSEIPVH